MNGLGEPPCNLAKDCLNQVTGTLLVKVVCTQAAILETMLVFHAPALAVTPPVIQAEKMPGVDFFKNKAISQNRESSAVRTNHEAGILQPSVASIQHSSSTR